MTTIRTPGHEQRHANLATLSPRQSACFRAYAAGKMHKEIATDMGITEKAVHALLVEVRRKLGMRLPPAIVAATRAGFFDCEVSKTVDTRSERQKVLDLVRANPGMRRSEIARRLGKGPGATSRHLHLLHQAGELRPSGVGVLTTWSAVEVSSAQRRVSGFAGASSIFTAVRA